MSTLEEMVQAQADKLSVVKQEDLMGSAYCPTDPETKYLCIDGLEYNTSMKMDYFLLETIVKDTPKPSQEWYEKAALSGNDWYTIDKAAIRSVLERRPSLPPRPRATLQSTPETDELQMMDAKSAHNVRESRYAPNASDW